MVCRAFWEGAIIIHRYQCHHYLTHPQVSAKNHILTGTLCMHACKVFRMYPTWFACIWIVLSCLWIYILLKLLLRSVQSVRRKQKSKTFDVLLQIKTQNRVKNENFFYKFFNYPTIQTSQNYEEDNIWYLLSDKLNYGIINYHYHVTMTTNKRRQSFYLVYS